MSEVDELEEKIKGNMKQCVIDDKRNFDECFDEALSNEQEIDDTDKWNLRQRMKKSLE